jgi:hypothetical protein
MGIFFTSSRPVASTIESALEDALSTDPTTLRANLRTEAAARAHSVAKTAAPQFKLRNFIGALLISAALLITAICVDKSHPDIAKTLMTSFTSFSGIVLGLLGGEAQKSAS